MQNDSLRQSRAETEAALQRYADLYELAMTGYVTLDRSGVITQCNRAASALLACPQASLRGKHLASLVRTAKAPGLQAWLEQAFTTPHHPAPLEVGLSTSGLDHGEVQLDAVLLPDAQSCCVSLLNIHERTLLEAARSRASDLEVERLGAQAARKASTAILSRMSHELRTPLNAIMGFTQLLKLDLSQPLTEGQERRVNAVLRAGSELLELIEDMLRLASLDAGHDAGNGQGGAKP
jgi:signal transduction histidine kinase